MGTIHLVNGGLDGTLVGSPGGGGACRGKGGAVVCGPCGAGGGMVRRSISGTALESPWIRPCI